MKKHRYKINYPDHHGDEWVDIKPRGRHEPLEFYTIHDAVEKWCELVFHDYDCPMEFNKVRAMNESTGEIQTFNVITRAEPVFMAFETKNA